MVIRPSDGKGWTSLVRDERAIMTGNMGRKRNGGTKQDSQFPGLSK